MKIRNTLNVYVVLVSLATSFAGAAEWGLKPGRVDLRSTGTMTFGPDGILFVGDAMRAR